MNEVIGTNPIRTCPVSMAHRPKLFPNTMRNAIAALPLFFLVCMPLLAAPTLSSTPASPVKIGHEKDQIWVKNHLGKYFWVHPDKGGIMFVQSKNPPDPRRKAVFEVSKVERIKLVRTQTYPDGVIAVVRFDEGVEATTPIWYLQRATPTAKPTGSFNWVTSVDPRKAAKREGVSLGMTREEVLMSNWGKPRDINRTHTVSGTREQWVYDGGYLYFTNGILDAVQN